MPLPLGPPNTFRCALNWTQSGERCVNVIHVEDIAGAPVGPTGVANQVHDVFGNYMAVGLNNNTTLDFVTATEADSATPLIGTSTTAPFVGVATAAAMPNDKALVATLRTGLGGRSGRGRFYIMGLTVGDITDADPNHVDLAHQAQYQGFVDDCLAQLAATDLVWGVMSYYHLNPSPPPVTIPRTTAIFSPITSISVNRRLDTQRRRLPRV